MLYPFLWQEPEEFERWDTRPLRQRESRKNSTEDMFGAEMLLLGGRTGKQSSSHKKRDSSCNWYSYVLVVFAFVCLSLKYACEHFEDLVVRSQDMSEVGIAISMGVGDSGAEFGHYSHEIPILRRRISDVLSTAHNHVIGSCTAWVLWCSILIWHTSPIIICHLLVFVVILRSSTAEDKAINWKALELPLASQIKGLAILQEEGGEVSRCMAGFISHASRVCIEVFEFTVWWSRRLWVILGTKYIYII